MRRGDLVTVAARLAYAGKPRPAVIVQSDAFPIASVTLCLITAERIEPSDLRIPLEPDDINNLNRTSWIMIDKMLTVPRHQIGRVFGRLRANEISHLDRGLAVFLDFGGV
ncbi:MAG: type II toxin-antitoxin system PemK/MazF family toxin [Xanthobacteraceae bacterium]|nr:type II toxin-antitoxin system PemK/MazF family toxin [Xanthobacteraceae bacterium]